MDGGMEARGMEGGGTRMRAGEGEERGVREEGCGGAGDEGGE